MMLGMALEQFAMSDFAVEVQEKCWDICFDKNLTRSQLVAGDLPDATQQKMDNCARKCVARSFEIMKLMSESRELREKEAMQGLAPGTLSANSS